MFLPTRSLVEPLRIAKVSFGRIWAMVTDVTFRWGVGDDVPDLPSSLLPGWAQQKNHLSQRKFGHTA